MPKPDKAPNLAGPLFGAAIIGIGIGYMLWKKTGNPLWGALAAIGITVGDFIALLVINKIRGDKS